MINIDEVDKAIIELEQKDTSYAVVERLAWLYTVKDHLRVAKPEERTGELIGNEFMLACSGVPVHALLSVLSEHMDIIKVVYPKEYTTLLNKIRGL